ncbi:cell division protein [Enterococcus sp. HY326]|uniref:cell division protein n=1 Tax=Enterococcus sp. HY326 TaxID=2971265 RepID=UPI0022400219|nr:cell division protein [Enterococcus sp. HY326]
MKKITREDVSHILVKDKYYEKGHLGTKIFQSVVALVGWFGVILPFIWIFVPILFPDLEISRYFHSYSEEIRALMFLVIFLAISFVIILITYVSLTLWNNHRFGGQLRKETTYDDQRLATRRQVLNDSYNERFGSQEYRHTVKYYAVKEEQNLDTHFVADLYKENGVKL